MILSILPFDKSKNVSCLSMYSPNATYLYLLPTLGMLPSKENIFAQITSKYLIIILMYLPTWPYLRGPTYVLLDRII